MTWSPSFFISLSLSYKRERTHTKDRNRQERSFQKHDLLIHDLDFTMKRSNFSKSPDYGQPQLQSVARLDCWYQIVQSSLMLSLKELTTCNISPDPLLTFQKSSTMISACFPFFTDVCLLAVVHNASLSQGGQLLPILFVLASCIPLIILTQQYTHACTHCVSPLF